MKSGTDWALTDSIVDSGSLIEDSLSESTEDKTWSFVARETWVAVYHRLSSLTLTVSTVITWGQQVMICKRPKVNGDEVITKGPQEIRGHTPTILPIYLVKLICVLCLVIHLGT